MDIIQNKDLQYQNKDLQYKDQENTDFLRIKIPIEKEETINYKINKKNFIGKIFVSLLLSIIIYKKIFF
jgi:hypothetical protein